MTADGRTLVIAHRTCPLDAPENSREGIATAARLGADLVEIDVRPARDGVPVLSHDTTVRRVTGRRRRVRWTASTRLTGLALLGADEPLPSLADALAVLPDGLDLAVDVKDGRAMAAAIEVLAAHGMLDRARLWSGDRRAVAVAAAEAPGGERAFLRNTETEAAALAYLDDAVAVGATAVSVMDVSLTPAVVAAGHERGLTVHCWVRTLDAQAPVLACRPDGVVTDFPAEARRAIDGA
ncbi:MAG: glycerophosphodiester phosphodiesterase [Acidimicrobiales bacterium]|nr:glycerophosphodiester phosphodiesterase [Acidimicrobiales bacterium]